MDVKCGNGALPTRPAFADTLRANINRGWWRRSGGHALITDMNQVLGPPWATRWRCARLLPTSPTRAAVKLANTPSPWPWAPKCWCWAVWPPTPPLLQSAADRAGQRCRRRTFWAHGGRAGRPRRPTGAARQPPAPSPVVVMPVPPRATVCSPPGGHPRHRAGRCRTGRRAAHAHRAHRHARGPEPCAPWAPSWPLVTHWRWYAADTNGAGQAVTGCRRPSPSARPQTNWQGTPLRAAQARARRPQAA